MATNHASLAIGHSVTDAFERLAKPDILARRLFTDARPPAEAYHDPSIRSSYEDLMRVANASNFAELVTKATEPSSADRFDLPAKTSIFS